MADHFAIEKLCDALCVVMVIIESTVFDSAILVGGHIGEWFLGAESEKLFFSELF